MNQRGISINTILVTVAIVGLIGVIVLAAISSGSLWSLIGGVLALGVISIGLSWIGVNLFGRYTDAVLKRDTLRYGHIEAMAECGYLPNNETYKAMPSPMIEYDVPVDTHGMTDSTIAPFKADALKVVEMSVASMGDKSDQIVPYAFAKENDYFRSGDGFVRWQNGCRWLIANQWAAPRKAGNRSKGTFCTSGTVGQLYARLKQ